MLLPKSRDDRREYRRITNHARVAVRQVLKGVVFSGTLADVSRGGCLLLLDEPMKLSFFELVELKLSGSHLEFPMMGYVRHSEENGRSAGIQFHRYRMRTITLDAFLWSLHVASLPEKHPG